MTTPQLELQAQLPLPVFRVEGRYVRDNSSTLEQLILQLMQRRQFAQVSLEQVANALHLELPLLEVALRTLLQQRHLNLLEPRLENQLYAVRFNQLEISPLRERDRNAALFRSEHYCYDFLRQQVRPAQAQPEQARLLSLPAVALTSAQQEQAQAQLLPVFIERQRILDPQGYRFEAHIFEQQYAPTTLTLSVQLGRAELELSSADPALRSYLHKVEREQWQAWIPALCVHLKRQGHFELLDQTPPQSEELIPAEQLLQFTTWQFKRTHGSYPGIKIHVECTKPDSIPSSLNLQTSTSGVTPLVLKQDRFIGALFYSGMFGNHLEFTPNKNTVVGDFFLSDARLCHRRVGYCELDFAGRKLYVPVEGLQPLETTNRGDFDGGLLLDQLYQALIELEGEQALQLPLQWSLHSNDSNYANVNEYIRLLVYMSAWLPPATVIKSMGTVSLKVVREFMAEYQRVMEGTWQHLSWKIAKYNSVEELRMHQEIFSSAAHKLDFVSYAAPLQLEIITDLIKASNLGNKLDDYFQLIADKPVHDFAEFAQQNQAYFKWVNRKGELLTVEDFPHVRGFNQFAQQLKNLCDALSDTCAYECRAQVRELFKELETKVDAVKHKLNDSFYTLPERESRPILIVDTNVFLLNYRNRAEFDKLFESLQRKYFIVVPDFVQEELNNLKNSKDQKMAFNAREGMRKCEELNQHAPNQLKESIFKLLGTTTQVVHDSEEMDKKIRAVACSYLLYPVFVFSHDRGNRVMSQSLGLQIAPEQEQLMALASNVKSTGRASFNRR